MNKLTPATEFTLSLFHFTVAPRDPQARERLGRAIDGWRAERWLGAGPYTRQLAIAADRALSATPADLDKALAGIAETQKLAADERSMESQAELERAREANAGLRRRGTRWDERADLQ